MEWFLLDDRYDFEREIRSSGYADMLNDEDRNQKYYYGLRKVISELKKDGQRVHVLDIGCGTGILSMMALSLGADKVTACESFEPMYDCAEKVFKDNGFWGPKLDLFYTTSTSLQVGVNMTDKANVLVSEIFDSELIGEGVLPVFEHAVKNLLTDDAKIIPNSAYLYIQPIQSSLLKDHNRLKENKYIPKFPPQFYTCTGYCSGYDVQASSLVCDDSFKPLSPPTLVKVIDFKKVSSKDSRITFIKPVTGEYTTPSLDTCFISLPPNAIVDAFIFWWKLVMTNNDDGYRDISTAPRWTYNSQSDYKWRDHWLQMALFTPNILNKKDCNLKFIHDTHSIWIDNAEDSDHKPRCTCDLHLHISRSRLCQLNSSEYNKQMEYIVRHVETKGVKSCLVVSDFSYLPLYLAERGIKTHNIINNDAVRQLTESFFLANPRLSSYITVSTLDNIPDIIFDAVISEPFFVCSMLPWENIHYWYILDRLRNRSLSHLSFISPRKMSIKVMFVEFEHLHKIGAPVGVIHDFDLRNFDKIIQKGSEGELHFESRSLWEYDCYSRSEVGDLLTVDFMTSIEDLLRDEIFELAGSYTFHLSLPLKANALVMWTTYEVMDHLWIDNNLTNVGSQRNKITWKPFKKQAIHFLHKDLLKSLFNQVTISCYFNLENGHFKFLITY